MKSSQIQARAGHKELRIKYTKRVTCPLKLYNLFRITNIGRGEHSGLECLKKEWKILTLSLPHWSQLNLKYEVFVSGNFLPGAVVLQRHHFHLFHSNETPSPLSESGPQLTTKIEPNIFLNCSVRHLLKELCPIP